MCIQHTCPNCSAPFTSPNSIARCAVFVRHHPPLDPRRLTCPANNWTMEPHPQGFHPGANRCPDRPVGPYDLADNNENNRNNNSGLPTTTATTTIIRPRPLAPAPRPRRFPHEGSDLYVRPGDLFKPGVWQRVSEALKRASAEGEKSRLMRESHERGRQEGSALVGESARGNVERDRGEEGQDEEEEEEEEGEKGEEEGRQVGGGGHYLVAAQWRTG